MTSVRLHRYACGLAVFGVLACRGMPRAQVVVAPHGVLPIPQSMQATGGPPFVISASTPIVVEGGDSAAKVARSLAMLLRPSTGHAIAIVSPAEAGTQPAIWLSLRPDATTGSDERYSLTVTPNAVRLAAAHPAGLFRGVQTLRQLLPVAIESHMAVDKASWAIAAVTIEDAPRFAWRGAMLDVARHFFTVKEVEQYIDLLALYKMNVLHLHLSDDQGFRVVIDARPRLTDIGAVSQVGGGEGGFYTKADYATIVRYAADRFITIVPEVDMPGHTNAALSAYPDVACSVRPSAPYAGTDVGWSTVCVDNEASYALLDDIIGEISAMSPGKYFHVGGDEVHTLSSAKYIQFVERVQELVAKHGKLMIGWEEIGKAHLLPTTIVQQWKGDSAQLALKYGAKILLSPANKTYLDMKYTSDTPLGLTWAALIDVRDAYEWDPATFLTGTTEQDLVGVEAPLWSETIRNISAAMTLALPRLPAIAEVGWSPQQNRHWEDFRERLAAQARRWDYLGMSYYRSGQVPW
ncbi:MAG: beta-N-acetylhexosaminidase [bacterium]